MRSFITKSDPGIMWIDYGSGKTNSITDIKMGKTLTAQKNSWLSVKEAAESALIRIEELEKMQ